MNGDDLVWPGFFVYRVKGTFDESLEGLLSVNLLGIFSIIFISFVEHCD